MEAKTDEHEMTFDIIDHATAPLYGAKCCCGWRSSVDSSDGNLVVALFGIHVQQQLFGERAVIEKTEAK